MTARVANWLQQIVHWTLPKLGIGKKPTVPISQEERLARSLGKFEPYVFQIQSILIWENPLVSALSLLAVNFIFWFVVNYECRLYGMLFTVALMIYSHQMWTEQIWPEISIPVPGKPEPELWTPQHPSGVLSVPEISGYLVEVSKLAKAYHVYLRTLRSEQPGIFCCEMCGVFGALLFIGRAMSGITIAYCILMITMVAPGVCIHILPPATLSRIANVLANFRHQSLGESDCEVEDMMPDATMENLSLLHLAGELDNSSDKEDSEFTFDPALSELTGSLPESSLDDLDDLDLRPTQRQRCTRNGSPLSDSDDSSNDAGIHFRSSHFNGDTSSEEEAFTQGLAFTDSPAQQQPVQAGPTLMSGLAQNLSSLGSSLISSVMSRAVATEPRLPRPSSSDSDEFEIIDNEDVS